MFSVIVWLWTITITALILVYFTKYAKDLLPASLLRPLLYGKQRDGKIVFGDVPKRWFTHFYLVGTIVDMVVLYQVFQCLVFGGKMGIPLVADVLQALTSVDVGTGSSEKTARSEFNHVQLEVLLGLGLLFLQTSRRLYECVAIVDYSKEAKIHVSHYLLGYIFYLLRAPLVVLHLTSYDGVNVASSTNGIMSAFKWNHLLGMGIFVYGAYHQYVCHCILADLRSNKSITATSSNSKQYSIPYGDWFKYTSSPHYFAEIVLYVGVCLTLWGFTPAWLIPLFTVSCLSFSAYWTHRWYLKEFPEYKKLNRTSIIPYVW